MTTTRGAIPRVKPPLSAEERLARAARVADRAAADVVTAQAAAVAAQAEIDDVIAPQVVAVTQGVQIAQSTSNTALTVADQALASGTVSGSATDPAVSTGTSEADPGAWAPGPQVSLTGVVAGTLTITGTGPQQDGDVVFYSGGTTTGFVGEFRVVEIEGAAETVLGTFDMSASPGSGLSAIISNDGASDVAAFSVALTTTGTLGYRIDVRRVSGGNLDSLKLYIYARRAA